MANSEIKREIMGAGLRLWQVASELGFTDSWFSRKLRQELTDGEKAEIRAIISKLVEREAE